MSTTCRECQQGFEITEQDRALIDKCSPIIAGEKIEIPMPDRCPECRLKRRMLFRNESSLHWRKCDVTGKNVLSVYPQDVAFPVYSPEVWFGDSWDGRDQGRDFDFSRPFFEQFAELRDAVPHLSLVSSNNQNCDYCNTVGDCKNCFMIYGSIYCEDCYYGSPFNCKQCVDSLLLRESELCLECSDSSKLYECFYCRNCNNSNDLWFCDAVQNSNNCFGCVNLNHAKYCILNEQKTKEEYQAFLDSIDLRDPKFVEQVKAKVAALKRTLPHRAYVGVNNENVSGDHISNSKDCHNCYGIAGSRDVSNGFQALKINDCMDVCNAEHGELCYDVMALYSANRCIFSYYVWDGADSLMYSAFCNKNVRDCFGCVGLKHAQYCILNKQYSKGEYEELLPRIIEYMRSTGEWGQFFPEEFAPFSAEESIRSAYYPEGELAEKDFKIIPQEQKFYDKYGLALPQKSPRQRHIDRIATRNPMKLWKRDCDKCGVEMETTFAPDDEAQVYCEACYLKEVY
jgi:hypothetical protein